MEYTHHKFIKGNAPNYTCVLSNQRLGLAVWVFQGLDVLWVPLPKAQHLPLSGLRAAVSLSCLSAVLGRLCLSIPYKSYLPLGPTVCLTTDYTKSVTSSQLYASGGWAVSLIKVNTSFFIGFGKSSIFIFVFYILIWSPRGMHTLIHQKQFWIFFGFERNLLFNIIQFWKKNPVIKEGFSSCIFFLHSTKTINLNKPEPENNPHVSEHSNGY